MICSLRQMFCSKEVSEVRDLHSLSILMPIIPNGLAISNMDMHEGDCKEVHQAGDYPLMLAEFHLLSDALPHGSEKSY